MIRRILKRDSLERPTIADLCRHPWVTGGDATEYVRS